VGNTRVRCICSIFPAIAVYFPPPQSSLASPSAHHLALQSTASFLTSLFLSSRNFTNSLNTLLLYGRSSSFRIAPGNALRHRIDLIRTTGGPPAASSRDMTLETCS